MAGAGWTYVSARVYVTIGALVLALVAGIGRSLFGTGTVHVIADGAVEVLVDGKPVEVESISEWHRRASISTGKHTVQLRAGGEERTFEVESTGHSVHLLPLREQCFVWTAYLPYGRQYTPKVMQRFGANSPAIVIPDGTLFGAEVDSIQGPPAAVFGTINCASLTTITDAEILGIPERMRVQCSSGGVVRDFDGTCRETDLLSIVVPAKSGAYAAIVLALADGSRHVMISGEAGSRSADVSHPLVFRDADGNARLLGGATVIVLMADAPITEARALAGENAGTGGGGGASRLQREIFPIAYGSTAR